MPDRSGSAKASSGTHLSRHYRRAQQDRGAETRDRLIAAALDAFGRYGFEGASTREIARRADANLAAIVYHFGSKEALHLAVAEYVVEELRRRLAPGLEALQGLAERMPIDKREARVLLQRLVELQVDTMLGEADAELWARFILREQIEPTSAFDIIYGFMSNSHSLTQQLVSVLLDIDPASEEASLRVFAMFGQIIIFRVAQPMVLRTIDRPALDPASRRQILEILTGNIDRIVGVNLADASAS